MVYVHQLPSASFSFGPHYQVDDSFFQHQLNTGLMEGRKIGGQNVLRFYLQFVCHDAVDVDICATQEQRPESLILGNQPTAEVLRTYQVTDMHHTSVQEDSRSSIQASAEATRLGHLFLLPRSDG